MTVIGEYGKTAELLPDVPTAGIVWMGYSVKMVI